MRVLTLTLLLAACGGPDAPPAAARPDQQPTPPTGGAPSPTDAAPEPSPDAMPAPSPDATPDAVTRASPAWDAGVPVVTAGTVDGAALMARTRARLVADDSAVHLLTGGTAEDLGRRACEAAVPRVPADTPILLKPNIGGFNWFKNPKRSGGDDGLRGRTTDPAFVRGVIRCLKARGHTRLTLAEGWGATPKDWQRLMTVSGYGALAEAEGIPMVALQDDGVFDVQGDQPGKPLAVSGLEGTRIDTVLMPKALAEHLAHGLVISLPKIKAHRFAVFSAGLKGMQGTVYYSDAAPAYLQRWRTHRELGPWRRKKKAGEPAPVAEFVSALEVFADRIAALMLLEAPHVVLAEGAPAMNGDGFVVLTPTPEPVAIAGTHPVKVDRVVAAYLGLWDNAALAAELGGHRTSPVLTAAAETLGLDLTTVKVAGDGAGLLDRPRPYHLKSMAGFEIRGTTGGAPTTVPPGADRPTVTAVALGADTITLDGRADEPVWTRAVPAVWTTDYAGQSTPHRTEVRFAWASDGLYLHATLHDTGLNTDRSRPVAQERFQLYKEDCLELFLDPDPSTPKAYLEIELGPFGHVFDLKVNLAGRPREDMAWNSDARVATTQDAAGRVATIEAKLTNGAITAALRSGALLPLGLFRMEGKGRRAYLAWSPPRTPKPKFHVPEAFGRLRLE